MAQKVNKMTLNPKNLGMKPKAFLASNSHALTNFERVFFISSYSMELLETCKHGFMPYFLE